MLRFHYLIVSSLFLQKALVLHRVHHVPPPFFTKSNRMQNLPKRGGEEGFSLLFTTKSYTLDFKGHFVHVGLRAED